MCSEENSDFQGCINNVCVLVVLSCLTLATLWTVARQAPLSMGFSRKEYWSGLPFPPPGDLPNPDQIWVSVWQEDSLTSELPKASINNRGI